MDSDTARMLRTLEQRITRLETKPAPLSLVGTYVPTYTGGTTPGAGQAYTTQDGYYRRLADVVFFNGRITWTGAGTAAGNAQISLPFTAATATSGTYRWSGSLWTNNVTIGAFSPQMLISGGGAFFLMTTPANNAANAIIQIEAAGDVIFSGWYYV